MATAANRIDAPPALQVKLKKLGLLRGDDLVLHLPMRYEDETQVVAIAQAPTGFAVQVEARVLDVAVQFRPRRQLVARVADESGELVLRFLNFYGSQTRQLEKARDEGRKLRLFGEIRPGFLGAEMVHPRYRVVGENEPLPQALTPVYPTTAGLSQNVLRKLIAPALAQADLTELLDSRWCRAHALPAFEQAVRLLHAPPPGVPEAVLQQRTHPAWRRIKFDEILAQQLSLRRAYLARRRQGATPLHAAGELARRLLAALPFELTTAQRRVNGEISADLGRMSDLVDQGVEVLCGDGCLSTFGEILHESWTLKRGLSSTVSNDMIDDCYLRARKSGAIGGKLLGAGSGGFLLLFVEPDRRDAVRAALPELKCVNFEFDSSGSRILFYHPR